MNPMSDIVTTTIERAMSGVAQRQRVTADNIANVSTPGFRAHRVTFEDSLARAVGSGDPSSAAVSTSATTAPGGPDGNNVVLEDETATLVKSGLQFDALVAALNYKLGLLRTAIGGR